jgi:HSP20 family protein
MELVRWRPRRDLVSVHDEVDRVFDRFLGNLRPFADYEFQWNPSVDVAETESEVTVKAELPGMEPKDIDVNVLDNVLTISGEKKSEEEESTKNYYHSELRYGAFTRRLTLPSKVETGKINAEYKNGVLTVTMPKAEEAKVQKVNIDVK